MSKITHGVLLTGGNGTRLAPFNSYISKHLLNVAGKPIIDYPIATLKQMGVTDLTVVLGSNHSGQLVNYIGDGSQYELNINFVFQREAKGISQAINLTQRYLANAKDFTVILGDNFYENPIDWHLTTDKAQIVLDCGLKNNPRITRFGVLTFETSGNLTIREKPQELDLSLDNYPITGCYRFNQRYFEFFKETQPSARSEWEVTDIIRKYLEAGELKIAFHRDGLWSDMGEFSSIDYVNNYLFTKSGQ